MLLGAVTEVPHLGCVVQAQVPVPLVRALRLVERLCFLARKHRIGRELCGPWLGIFWVSFLLGERMRMSPWLVSLWGVAC